MAKYLFIYHGGGGMPDNPEEGARVMAAWQAWFGDLGAAVIDGGAPVSTSKTVNSDKSVTDGGGANPATGYSIVEAATHDDAVAMAKGCPILDAGGGVEVAERVELG